MNRRLAQATSSGEASIPAAAASNDGWASTGATTLASVIMASAEAASEAHANGADAAAAAKVRADTPHGSAPAASLRQLREPTSPASSWMRSAPVNTSARPSPSGGRTRVNEGREGERSHVRLVLPDRTKSRSFAVDSGGQGNF